MNTNTNLDKNLVAFLHILNDAELLVDEVGTDVKRILNPENTKAILKLSDNLRKLEGLLSFPDISYQKRSKALSSRILELRKQVAKLT